MRMRRELLVRFFSSPATNKRPIPQATSDDLNGINLLVPRLLDSGHLDDATRLVVDSLILRPPLASLPLPLLVHRLADQPSTAPPFNLLTALRRTGPHCHYALPLACRLLAAFYLKARRFKDALKVFDHMSRLQDAVPGLPAEEDFGMMIRGLTCGGGTAEEVVRVLGKLVSCRFAIAPDVRERVVGYLLREARVKEAKELEAALEVVADGEGAGRSKAVAALVEGMLRDCDWRV